MCFGHCCHNAVLLCLSGKKKIGAYYFDAPGSVVLIPRLMHRMVTCKFLSHCAELTSVQYKGQIIPPGAMYPVPISIGLSQGDNSAPSYLENRNQICTFPLLCFVADEFRCERTRGYFAASCGHFLWNDVTYGRQ